MTHSLVAGRIERVQALRKSEAAWELFIRTHKSGYPVELARERLRLLQADAEAKANAKRLAEERIAAEQRAREDAEAKLRDEAAAAKKRAEAAAKAQAEAKAKAQRMEDDRIAAEQRARKAEAARVEQQRLATVAVEAEAVQKSTTVVAALAPELHASQQTKQPTKLGALPSLKCHILPMTYLGDCTNRPNLPSYPRNVRD